MTIHGMQTMFQAAFTCFSPCLSIGGGFSQGIGTQPAYAVFPLDSSKNTLQRPLYQSEAGVYMWKTPRTEGPGVGGVGRGSGTCLWGGAFGRRVCGALCLPDWWAVVWAWLPLGLCRCRLATASGPVGWCLGLWSWVACGARAWAHLRVYPSKGLFGSGACYRHICGAGHGPPPSR